jgi:hypothetical protein
MKTMTISGKVYGVGFNGGIVLKEVKKQIQTISRETKQEIAAKGIEIKNILETFKDVVSQYHVQVLSPTGDNLLEIKKGDENFKLASVMKLYTAYYYLKAMQEKNSFNQKQKIDFAVEKKNGETNLYIRGNFSALFTENFTEIKNQLKKQGVTHINQIYFDDQFSGEINVPDGGPNGNLDIQSSLMCNWELKNENVDNKVVELLKSVGVPTTNLNYTRKSFPTSPQHSFSVEEHYTPREFVKNILKHSHNNGANLLLLRAAHLKYPNIKDKNQLWETALQDLDNLIDPNVEYDPKDGSGYYFAEQANLNEKHIPSSKVKTILQKYRAEFPDTLPIPKSLAENGINLWGKTGTVQKAANFAGFDKDGNMILIFAQSDYPNQGHLERFRLAVAQQFNVPGNQNWGAQVASQTVSSNETVDETAIQNFLQTKLNYTGNFAEFKNAFEPGAKFKLEGSPLLLRIINNGSLISNQSCTLNQIKNVNILEKFPSLESVNIFDANGGNFKTFTKLNNLKFLRINSGQSLNVPTDFIFPRGNLEDFRINDKFHYLEEKYY